MKQTKENKALFAKVKKYCASLAGAKIALTIGVGYPSTAAIDKWLHRKSIPPSRVKSVIEFFKQEDK